MPERLSGTKSHYGSCRNSSHYPPVSEKMNNLLNPIQTGGVFLALSPHPPKNLSWMLWRDHIMCIASLRQSNYILIRNVEHMILCNFGDCIISHKWDLKV